MRSQKLLYQCWPHLVVRVGRERGERGGEGGGNMSVNEGKKWLGTMRGAVLISLLTLIPREAIESHRSDIKWVDHSVIQSRVSICTVAPGKCSGISPICMCGGGGWMGDGWKRWGEEVSVLASIVL
jgi:hypothetical protein